MIKLTVIADDTLNTGDKLIVAITITGSDFEEIDIRYSYILASTIKKYI